MKQKGHSSEDKLGRTQLYASSDLLGFIQVAEMLIIYISKKN